MTYSQINKLFLRLISSKLILWFVCICLFVAPAMAQDETSQSTTQSNLLTDEDVAIYDADSDSYLIYKKGTEKTGRPHKVLTKEEFRKQSMSRAIRDSFKVQRDKNSLEAKDKGGLLSGRIQIKEPTLEGVIGGDISINASGSVEMLVGVKSTKIDNPLIPPQNRRTTAPYFDTKFQLNVNGNIGKLIKLDFSYNPFATFDFETNFKVGYQGDEDDILQKLEFGNVSMPLPGTLITGNHSLFGIKTELKFGHLSVTSVLSQQKGQSKTVEVRGGSQVNHFEVPIDEYDVNRHFFVSQYFRDNYERALSQLPLLLSGLTITKIEVWVTNKSNKIEDARDFVAFMDLGEPKLQNIYNTVPTFAATGATTYPANAANGMYKEMTTTYDIRTISNVNSSLSRVGYNFTSGQDYEKLERGRKLSASEFTYHPQLGYISLNVSLNSDEILAVAYEYSIMGQTYTVGELSTEGAIENDKALILKLLKGTIQTPKLPTWKLMMKNIYSLNAYNLKQLGFVLDVYYEDDAVGTATPYISAGAIDKKQLISVLGLDNLNSQSDPYPDGVFDFLPNRTIEPEKGRIIFPVLEPFGSHLKKQIKNNAIAEKYIYQELYDSTLNKAREVAEKNKFKLMGSFESESLGEIQLNATNIPEGSVVVTAGGTKLTEGVDYQVNYIAGTVSITNAGYLQSGIPIQVSLENRELFSLKSKTFVGTHLNYKFSENLNVGATVLRLSEKPLTQKVSYGEDPIANTIWGLNMSYNTESRFLTKMVNAIPLINTKAPSSFSLDAEFAQLLPGHSNGIGKEGTVFVDDFERAKSSLDLRNYLSWTLASTPQGMPDLFPEGSLFDDVKNAFKRAHLAWYWTDPEFLSNRSTTPSYMKQNSGKYQENHFIRQILYKELFPERQAILGASDYIQTLNLNFYPRERGSYNYEDVNIDSKGFLTSPATRWGGIMRPLPITDFETANYDYIEFWMMDPFIYNENSTGGDLYFNLGTISEDILRDGHKMHEQGIPFPYDTTKMIRTNWGFVPKTPSLVNTFDNNAGARSAQDLGLDGMGQEMEVYFFKTFLQNIQSIITNNPDALNRLKNDPSSDDFKYYRHPDYDQEQATIMDRYKYFNNTEGNSRTSESTGGQSEIYTNFPDMEDINKDNTMEENESYFQYRIKLNPKDMVVGRNYISDVKLDSVRLDNTGTQPSRWFQFKIPVSEYERAVGAISDFKSIRFMRMYMRGFQDTTVLRFATLELVRSDWRKYNYSLIEGQEGLTQPEFGNGQFEVSVVNIEENSTRTPVNYLLPPGTSRVIDPDEMVDRQLNEQAMQLKVADLSDGDSRAVYKTSKFDMRMYRRLKMDVHAEAIPGEELVSNDLSVFIRIGSDLRNNYYEYELPLQVTPSGFYPDNIEGRERVWPRGNLIDIELNKLTDLKVFRNERIRKEGGSISTMFELPDGNNMMRVIGNPNLGEIKTVLIGVRNLLKKEDASDKGISKSGIIWVNELRLSDFDEKGGWAANARASARLADFGNVAVAGSILTAGFGGLEQKLQERSQEDVYQYDIVSNFELGKFFSEKAGVHIPMFVSFSERYANPLYDPLSKDVLYKDAMRSLSTSREKDSLRNIAQDFTRRKSINFNNVRIAPPDAKQGQVLSIANLSLSFAYNETMGHNVNTEYRIQKEYRGAIGYAYNLEVKYFEPLKNVSFLQSKWLALIRDFNFNFVPNQFGFTTDIHRYYDERQNRNIAYPEVKLPSSYAKDFTWNRYYNLQWDLTRSLRLRYSATNIARIDEPEGIVNKKKDPEGYKRWRDSVWSNIGKFGRTVQYDHNFDLEWQVPFRKIPGFDWVNGSARYGGAFNWTAAPIMKESEDYTYDPGNTIGNRRDLGGTVGMSFVNLYNKVAYLKRINEMFDGRERRTTTEMEEVTYESRRLSFKANVKRLITHELNSSKIEVKVVGKDGKEIKSTSQSSGSNRVYITLAEEAKEVRVIVKGQVPKKLPNSEYAISMLVRMSMMLRNIAATYSQNESTILPGFKGNTKFLGLNSFNGRLAPGLDFVLGGQGMDFIERARESRWITGDSTMISPYVMRRNTSFNIRMTLEPIQYLKIELIGQRTQTSDRSMYNFSSSLNNTLQATGAFQITTNTLRTAFENPTAENRYRSKAFDNFNKHRQAIAWRLAHERQSKSSMGYDPGAGEFPNGYSKISPEVLIPSFYAAYTGKSASKATLKNFWNIPLPNWQVSYQGLSKIEALKKVLRTANINHSYTSIYSVNAYNQNSQYLEANDGFSYVVNTLGDFTPMNDILNVSIREDFNPLFGLDLGWKNDLSTKFEIRKSRALGLSLSNLQVNEMRSTEFTLGLGYFFREVPLIFRLTPDMQKTMKTNLRLDGSFSIRNDKTLIRSLDETERETQLYQGNKIVRFKLRADYAISANINLQAFFDRDINKPLVSAIPTSSTNVGFSIRISIGQ